MILLIPYPFLLYAVRIERRVRHWFQWEDADDVAGRISRYGPAKSIARKLTWNYLRRANKLLCSNAPL